MNTPYLYHRIPSNLEGDTLYPLSQLKEHAPAVYELAKSKYAGREFVMNYRIPELNCAWNDVLHFSPVHPQQVAEEFENANEGWRKSQWLQIDPSKCSFDATNTVLFCRPNEKVDRTSDQPGEFDPFSLEALDALTELPQRTKDYYQECFAKGERPLMWMWSPHVLHLGEIEITQGEIVVA